MSSKSIKLLVALLAVTAAAFFFWSIGDLVKLLIISAMLAYILDPIANALESHGFSRLGATAVIFLGMGIVLLNFGAFVIPAVIRELSTFQGSASAEQTTRV